MPADVCLVFPRSSFLINEAVYPPLGILYLASYLQKFGYKVECKDLGLNKSTRTDAPVVGISFTTAQRKEAYELAEHYNNHGKWVIAGGPHPTHMPEEVLPHFDVVVRGEGEYALHLCMRRFKEVGNLDNGGILESPSLPIDEIQIPDRTLLPINQYKYLIDGEPATPIMTTRGCPYNCAFCAKIVPNCRIQSAENTVKELFHIRDTLGFKAFMIFDDVFVVNKKRLVSIANGVRGNGFKFRCFARTDLVNADVVKILKDVGIVEVGLGVESGSDYILNKNMKGTTRQMNTNAVKLFHDFGIRVKAFLIVGLPGETGWTVNDTITWIQEASPDDIDVSIFQPLPGSKIFSHPDQFEIEFTYSNSPSWYKGTPGKYECNVRTKYLSSKDIIFYRSKLEKMFKSKELLR